MKLPIADFAPDLPPNNAVGASANLVNLYPRTSESWGPINSLNQYSSNALASQCIGALFAQDSAGNNYMFAGDKGALYGMSSGSLAWNPMTGSFTVPQGELWDFVQYGQRVIAASFGQNIQSCTLGSAASVVALEPAGTGNGATTAFSGTLAHGSVNLTTLTFTAGAVTGTDNGAGVIAGAGVSGAINYKTGAWTLQFTVAPANGAAITANYKYGGIFADLAAAAPQARYVTVIKDWVMVGNTYDATNGLQTQRVQWCAVGDPTTWPAAGSVQEAQLLAGSQVIPGDQGELVGLVGNLGGADGALFFERAIWRVVYSGAPTIFSFYPADGARGCVAPQSIVHVGAVAYYLGEDGFYAFDGQESVPIGLDKVDRWFWANINPAYLWDTIGAVDPVNRIVMWLFASTNSPAGVLDTMLIYNWALKKWGLAQLSAEYIFRAVSLGYSLDSLDSLGYTLDSLPFSLDSRVWTGGSIVIGIMTPQHNLSYMTGPALPATADTVEIQPFAEIDLGRQSIPQKRAFVHNSRPLVDGGTPSVQIGTRQRLIDAPTWSAASAINSNGECPCRADGRYVRARVTTSGSFTNLQGCDIYYRPSGSR